MSGRRVAPPPGRRSLDDLVRLACSTDPAEPVRRPRRAAIAPRAAMGAGAVLIVLAVILAARAVMLSPTLPAQSTGSTPAPSRGAAVPTLVDPADPVVPASGAPAGPSAPGAPGRVVVHVAGAVASPGVVTLPAGSRVADALEAAGGATADADTDQLNLARVLVDGEQVRVPRQGEDSSTWEAPPGPAQEAGAGSTGGLVNINTASATELQSLPGIGEALAQRIVDYREANGPFTSIDELTEVSGIGQAKLEALREEVTL